MRATGFAALVVTAALATTVMTGCGPGGATDDVVRGARPRPVPVDVPPAAPPPHVTPGASAAALAEDELYARLAAIPEHRFDEAVEAICFGIDSYYTGTEWDDLAKSFAPFQAEVLSAAREVDAILATSESEREAFLRTTCEIPVP
jgi:hypothetical protein